ncbi:MAG: alpha-galactosidase, partial [Ktedonobacteraceae bacterium]|nr:alpha-galactosidase [Ktedonobacteraceae bacterium]
MNGMQTVQKHTWRGIALSGLIALSLVFSLWTVIQPSAKSAHAENNGQATTPFMGWSTWDFVGTKPTAANVYAQAQALANSGLAAAGYNYVLLDDFWYLNPTTTVDANGYWAPDTSKFPGGLAALAAQVHGLGLKFGAYLTPGVPVAAVNQKTPIAGTPYTADQIAVVGSYEKNYNYHNVSYYIDYSKPGAQAYIDGWAKELASWGVDFLKMDGVGSFDIPDVQAWSSALNNSGRGIVFDLSNNLSISDATTWQANANAWRTQGDVECYSSCPGHQVSWAKIASRFGSAASWAQYAGPGGWNDLDAMDVADGSLDGITDTERQTYMTLWAMAAAPMYLGDDVTQMDSYGKSLLTNSAVIAVDQSGTAATQLTGGNSQIWSKKNSDGSYTVAFFNLGSSTATISVNWSSLGFSGTAALTNLWTGGSLGNATNTYSASVASHGTLLFKVVPGSGGGSSCGSFSGNFHIINRNSGKYLDVQSDSTADGAGIVQFSSNGMADQEWFFEDAGGGYCKIVNLNSGKLLNIPGASTTRGTQLIQYHDDGKTNSQWQLNATGSYYTIVSRSDGQYVDVK